MSDVTDVAKAIRSFTFRFTNEDELQEAIATGLATRGFPVRREVRLDEFARLDILTGENLDVAVEVKISGTSNAVFRQTERYLAYEAISGLVLVTSRVKHVLPRSTTGKPVSVVQLAHTALL